MAKMSANVYVIEDYENEPHSGPKKQTQTKPIQPSFRIKSCVKNPSLRGSLEKNAKIMYLKFKYKDNLFTRAYSVLSNPSTGAKSSVKIRDLSTLAGGLNLKRFSRILKFGNVARFDSTNSSTLRFN